MRHAMRTACAGRPRARRARPRGRPRAPVELVELEQTDAVVARSDDEVGVAPRGLRRLRAAEQQHTRERLTERRRAVAAERVAPALARRLPARRLARRSARRASTRDARLDVDRDHRPLAERGHRADRQVVDERAVDQHPPAAPAGGPMIGSAMLSPTRSTSAPQRCTTSSPLRSSPLALKKPRASSSIASVAERALEHRPTRAAADQRVARERVVPERPAADPLLVAARVDLLGLHPGASIPPM